MLNFAFLNWETLVTFSGAVGLTVVIVQLLKLPLDKVWKIPTRYLVYVICFGIMLAAQYFTAKVITIEIVAATVINAFVGTLTAMSFYERVIELPEYEKLNAAYKYMTTGELPGEVEKAGIVEDKQGAVGVDTTHWSDDQLRNFCKLNDIDIADCATREEIINRIEAT